MRLAAALACLALPAMAAEPAANPPGLTVDGMVQHSQTYTLAELKALPAQHVEANFTTMHGQDHHTWTGVKLWDLVVKAGLRDEPGHRTGMRHVLMVSGQDGYAAAFGIGEIDPAIGGKPVIVAYRQDDQLADLQTLRLIVPGDRHGARDVHDLVAVQVR